MQVNCNLGFCLIGVYLDGDGVIPGTISRNKSTFRCGVSGRDNSAVTSCQIYSDSLLGSLDNKTQKIRIA